MSLDSAKRASAALNPKPCVVGPPCGGLVMLYPAGVRKIPSIIEFDGFDWQS